MRTTRHLGAVPLLLWLLGVALILASALALGSGPGGSPGTASAPRLLLAEPQSRMEQTARDVKNYTEDTLRPIDPLTFADIPGYTPIALGARWWHALSSDGTPVALIVGDEGPVIAPTDGVRLYSPGRPPTAGTQHHRFLALDSSGTRLITRVRTVTITLLPGSRW